MLTETNAINSSNERGFDDYWGMMLTIYWLLTKKEVFGLFDEKNMLKD
jgi:hypothetical protein